MKKMEISKLSSQEKKKIEEAKKNYQKMWEETKPFIKERKIDILNDFNKLKLSIHVIEGAIQKCSADIFIEWIVKGKKIFNLRYVFGLHSQHRTEPHYYRSQSHNLDISLRDDQ